MLLLASFDSGLKLADRFADAFEAAGAAVQIASPTNGARRTLTPAQAAAVISRPVQFSPWSALVGQAAAVSAVVPIFEGPRVERFVRDLHARKAGATPLPVIGSAYVGMVLYGALDGYLSRSLADVLAVNSRRDFDEFRAAALGLGLPADNLLLSGLSLLPANPPALRGGPIRRVLFADQPSVPPRAAERSYLYSRLDAYARQHPDREVILRPRHRPGETTFHRMTYSPFDFARARALADNLAIDLTPIVKQLPSIDLLLTVSSTAALEGLAAGSRVAFIGDFLGERFLNGRLVDSGLVRTFDQIGQDDIGAPNERWLDDVFPARQGPAPAQLFADSVLTLVASHNRPHDEAWAHPLHQSRGEVFAAVSTGPSGRKGIARRAARRLLRR